MFSHSQQMTPTHAKTFLCTLLEGIDHKQNKPKSETKYNNCVLFKRTNEKESIKN